MSKFRIVVRIDNLGPEGQQLVPNYRTVDIESAELAKALECGTYSHAGVVGVESLVDSAGGKP